MNARIKFRKSGQAKFVGHLDVLRYFQKTFRRSDLPIAYSQGYSPHELTTFAQPLSVGLLSEAEYMDATFEKNVDPLEIQEKLNRFGTEDIVVVSVTILPDDAENSMSLVSGALYTISCTDFFSGDKESFWKGFLDFYSRDSVKIMKETKKGMTEVDVKPMIRQMECKDGVLTVSLDAGSKSNCKPEWLLNAYLEAEGQSFRLYDFCITRQEVYGLDGETEKPLSAF